MEVKTLDDLQEVKIKAKKISPLNSQQLDTITNLEGDRRLRLSNGNNFFIETERGYITYIEGYGSLNGQSRMFSHEINYDFGLLIGKLAGYYIIDPRTGNTISGRFHSIGKNDGKLLGTYFDKVYDLSEYAENYSIPSQVKKIKMTSGGLTVLDESSGGGLSVVAQDTEGRLSVEEIASEVVSQSSRALATDQAPDEIT